VALGFCNRTDLRGSWGAGKSKLRTFNAKLDQEGPALCAALVCSMLGDPGGGVVGQTLYASLL
jgi:hypothetical protein